MKDDELNEKNSGADPEQNKGGEERPEDGDLVANAVTDEGPAPSSELIETAGLALTTPKGSANTASAEESEPSIVVIEVPAIEAIEALTAEENAAGSAATEIVEQASVPSVDEQTSKLSGSLEPQKDQVRVAIEPAQKELRFLTLKAAVRDFLMRRGIVILFDGSLRHNELLADDLGAKIRMTMINRQFLEDEFSLSAEAVGMKSSEIKRVIRRVLDEEQRRRVADLAEPLFVPLTAAETEKATDSWLLLASVFEQDTALTVAKLRHFVWQVKRKIIKAEVKRHMMLVVVGAKQGTGKSQFVDRMVSPWAEAATGPVLISDIADARSADIFRFPIAKIDDMEKVQRDKIAVLKSVITGTTLRRRMLGTMDSTGFVQALTLVGTANHDILELVDDDTGHRRFASLTMREWAGGAENNPYWKIINGTDFPLLWRSVPADDVAPIEMFLDLLESEQTSGALKTSLLAWLKAFDPNAPEVLAIERNDGIGASGLYELFVSQTDSLMSQTEFGVRMRRYAGRPDVPFGIKKKSAESNIYPLKARRPRPKHYGGSVRRPLAFFHSLSVELRRTRQPRRCKSTGTPFHTLHTFHTLHPSSAARLALQTLNKKFDDNRKLCN